MGEISIRGKIGQCFTVRFLDAVITPETLIAINKLNCGGLRLVPWERVGLKYQKGQDRNFHGGQVEGDEPKRTGSAIYALPTEYAGILNKLQEMAISRPGGVPLHFSIDQEGDFYGDFNRGGVSFFPSQMGLTAANDPKLTDEIFYSIGRQLKSIGIHFLHSPVLDVNVNPKNSEIGTRSFSDDPEKVAKMGLIALKALRRAGVCAVAKHFPGRGNSEQDAHYETVYYPSNRTEMEEIDLLPYRRLIKEGLKSIMVAHTIYPALGDAKNPASVSWDIVTGLLRQEMKFDGIVTTDSITMRGLMDKFGLTRACIMALKGGCDLILYRGPVGELVKVVDEMEEAVKLGILPIKTVEAALERVYRFKKETGIFENPFADLSKIEAVIHDKKIKSVASDAPYKTAQFIRKRKTPSLNCEQNILVVEQLSRYAWQCNDLHFHPGILFECIMSEGDPYRIKTVETAWQGDEKDRKRVCDIIDWADVVVATALHDRCVPGNIEFLRWLHKQNKPLVIITNSPYSCAELDFAETLLLNFASGREGLSASVKILFGQKEPYGKWPLKNWRLMSA